MYNYEQWTLIVQPYHYEEYTIGTGQIINGQHDMHLSSNKIVDSLAATDKEVTVTFTDKSRLIINRQMSGLQLVYDKD